MDNYQIAKTEAELLASNLAINETIYANCPVCQGKKKFSVTRLANSVAFHCFRASCEGTSGHSHTGLLIPPSKPKSRSKLRPYTDAMLPLTQEQREFLVERFPWMEGRPRITDKSTPDGRFILPIKNPLGYERGYLIRDFPERGLSDYLGPKAMTHMHAAGPAQGWFGDPDRASVVLVEDLLSAYAVSLAGYRACALLGTHLDNDKVREIAMERHDEVIIALDADATDQAFRLARKWGLAFNKTRVAVLERDLKDEHDLHDIPEVLGVEPK